MNEEQQTPAQVAELLGVGTTALKKYALLLEQHGHAVGRNDKNHRYYTGTDIGIIKAMLVLNRSKGVQLERAADIVTSIDTDIEAILGSGDTETDTHNTELTVTTTQDGVSSALIAAFVTQQQELFRNMEKMMSEYQAEISTQLLEQVERFDKQEEKLDKQTKQIEDQSKILSEQAKTIKEMQKQIEDIPKAKHSFWSKFFQ